MTYESTFVVCQSVLGWHLQNICFRAFGILIIEDNDKAWFPSEDLREFHGIVPHQVTAAEKALFCIRDDGTEGLCCPTGDVDEDDT
jgi:solute carrier family 6 amino acid/orphan transporter-like 15/16/17/18/20